MSATRIHPTNLEQSQAWDGDEGDFWAAHAQRFDDAVAAYHRALMESADVGATDRVLDIGCGTGQTTRDAARAATAGSALGVDLSHRMLEVARQRAHAESLTNVSFECTDAQVHPFEPGSFDLALSRSGTMFFADPVAGFANIARAMRPGGRLVQAVWQRVAENEWFRVVIECMAAGRDLPAPAPDAVSPFALSDPARVDRILAAAGFATPSYVGLHEPMLFGSDPQDAFEFVSTMVGWMLEGLDAEGRQRALSDLHEAMGQHHQERGVVFGSSMWLITTTRRFGS